MGCLLLMQLFRGMAKKTAAAFQRCHKCLSAEGKSIYKYILLFFSDRVRKRKQRLKDVRGEEH